MIKTIFKFKILKPLKSFFFSIANKTKVKHRHFDTTNYINDYFTQ